MTKALLCLIVGVGIGAGIVLGVRPGSAPPPQPPGPPAKTLECDDSELKRMRQRVAELESELVSAHHPSEALTPPTVASAVEAPAPSMDDATTWRISAIEKFVPLTDEQRERLRSKYSQERAGEGETESLDDILGSESASYYRERVQASFKKVQDEEVERDVVWLARKLTLSEAQESSVRAILGDVEAEVNQGSSHGQAGATPQDRVRAMIAENRRRSELRNERLKQVLTPEQFQSYLQLEAESSASDVEIFHDSGGGAPTPTVSPQSLR